MTRVSENDHSPRLMAARQLFEGVIGARPGVPIAAPVHADAALLMQTPDSPPPWTPCPPSTDVAADLARLLGVTRHVQKALDNARSDGDHRHRGLRGGGCDVR